ncbi:MAG: hypothetical protein ACOX6V_02430 [Patescibacteria group bacterium]|jgi:hypothetical protein
MAQNKPQTKKEELIREVKGDLIDPTQNAQEFVVDTQGFTGVTVSNQGDDITQTDIFGKLNEPSVREGMSDAQRDINRYKSLDPEEDRKNNDTVPKNLAKPPELDIRGTGNDTLNEATPPSVEGEQSVSGDMPDPASDDDTLENAQNMGFKLDEDTEHPKPLDTAGDIDRAEEYHRRK